MNLTKAVIVGRLRAVLRRDGADYLGALEGVAVIRLLWGDPDDVVTST